MAEWRNTSRGVSPRSSVLPLAACVLVCCLLGAHASGETEIDDFLRGAPHTEQLRLRESIGNSTAAEDDEMAAAEAAPAPAPAQLANELKATTQANAQEQQKVQAPAQSAAQLAKELKAMMQQDAQEEQKVQEDKKELIAQKISAAGATNKVSEKLVEKTKDLLNPAGVVVAAENRAKEAKELVAAADKKIAAIKQINAGLVAKAKGEADDAAAAAEAAAAKVQSDKAASLNKKNCRCPGQGTGRSQATEKRVESCCWKECCRCSGCNSVAESSTGEGP